MLRIKPSTLPFISLTRLVVAAFSSSGAGTALTSSSCQGLQKDVEGAASKGAGRLFPKPKARELSLKCDSRNTRRVLKEHQRVNTFLEFLGNRSSQGLQKFVEGAATKGAGSSSPEPGDAATLFLKWENQDATR